MRVPRTPALALLAGLAAAAPAQASPYNVQILSIDGANAVYSPCGLGGQYTFPLIPGSAVGEVWTVDVDMSTSPWTTAPIRKVGTSCPTGGGALPGQSPGPPGPGQTFGPFPGATFGPGGGNVGGGGGGGGESATDLARALPGRAFSHVATIKLETYGFSGGELSATVTGAPGLPAAFRAAYLDTVGDQSAIVLIARNVRVRGGRAKLDDAENVTVKGTLLRPAKWRQDEDGNKVVTFRAKRVTIN